jgi:hypothetical protein
MKLMKEQRSDKTLEETDEWHYWLPGICLNFDIPTMEPKPTYTGI